MNSWGARFAPRVFAVFGSAANEKASSASKRKLGSKPMACARTGAEASPSGSENVNAAMVYLDRRSFLLYTPNMKKIGGNAKTLMLIPPPSIPRAF